MIRRIHHVNFLVRDLDRAVQRYGALLDGAEPILEDLPQRGVRTARFRVGETWLVLLQPLDPDGIPGRHLARHGEGFFMISFGSDTLDPTLARLESEGIGVRDREDRTGLDGWRVRDLEPEAFFDVCVQLTRLD